MKSFFRIIFVLAGLYNLSFGLWLFSSPGSLFNYFSLPLLMPDLIYRILAVIIALFSAIYFYAAFNPAKSKMLIVLGLLSKIAPIVLLTGLQFFIGFDLNWYKMLFINDLIWWIPFYYYLKNYPTGVKVVA